MSREVVHVRHHYRLLLLRCSPAHALSKQDLLARGLAVERAEEEQRPVVGRVCRRDSGRDSGARSNRFRERGEFVVADVEAGPVHAGGGGRKRMVGVPEEGRDIGKVAGWGSVGIISTMITMDASLDFPSLEVSPNLHIAGQLLARVLSTRNRSGSNQTYPIALSFQYAFDLFDQLLVQFSLGQPRREVGGVSVGLSTAVRRDSNKRRDLDLKVRRGASRTMLSWSWETAGGYRAVWRSAGEQKMDCVPVAILTGFAVFIRMPLVWPDDAKRGRPAPRGKVRATRSRRPGQISSILVVHVAVSTDR